MPWAPSLQAAVFGWAQKNAEKRKEKESAEKDCSERGFGGQVLGRGGGANHEFMKYLRRRELVRFSSRPKGHVAFFLYITRVDSFG